MKSVAMAVVVLLLTICGTDQCCWAQAESTQNQSDVQRILTKLAGFKPDPCGPPYEVIADPSDVEENVFQQAEEIAVKALNENPAGRNDSLQRASQALKRLEQLSADINAAWPEENRFHFQMLDLSPALVVKMTIGTHDRFYVFGIPAEARGEKERLWQQVGSDEEVLSDRVPQSHLELYPLHRSASGNARFLARFYHSGCAGSIGVLYDAREWDPRGSGGLDQIIKQGGSFGLDDKVPGFPQIGKFQTDGTLITLPFCWFSRIDTWDNPSLCAIDTYDLSGDAIRFQRRTYNRPDLLPIAKAIEYAQDRDYPALLGYCTSADVARALVREFPPNFFAEDVKVTHTGKGKERVELGFDHAYRFDVEEQAGRWRIVAFRAE